MTTASRSASVELWVVGRNGFTPLSVDVAEADVRGITLRVPENVDAQLAAADQAHVVMLPDGTLAATDLDPSPDERPGFTRLRFLSPADVRMGSETGS